MGCKCSKSPVVVSSVDVKARCEEPYQLLAELRSLGITSWPPPALMLEESSPHQISLAIAGTHELKEAISKNPGLLSFLNDYLNVIIMALTSLTGVEVLLDKPRIILSDIHLALEFFEKENASTKKYSKTMGKLKELRMLGNLIVGLNIDELQSACERQLSLLALLRQRNHELERSLKSVKKWRKAWNVICIAGVLVALTCSVILAALASPAAAIAGATASATAMKSIEPCINSLWDEWESSLQEEKDIMTAMQRKGGLAMHELENMRSIVEKLLIDIDVLLKSVDFATSKEDGEEIEVKIGIENIMGRKGEFEKNIDSLKEKLDSSYGEIRKTTIEFLEIIMKDT